MKKPIQIMVAEAAGNVTIFVKDHFERSEYQKIASQLLQMEELKGEQVAFIVDVPEGSEAQGKIEMAGLEFCGNASRTFGLLLAEERGMTGHASVLVDVSGCDETLKVDADTITRWAKVKMPMPKNVETLDISGLGLGADIACKVDMDGIIHLAVKGIESTEENFHQIKDYAYTLFDAPALGVMFCDDTCTEIVPVVYVKDVDTTYFEGSCGSGATACAAAFGMRSLDGRYYDRIKQPAGSIDVTVEIKNGKMEKIFIESDIRHGEVQTVEVES